MRHRVPPAHRSTALLRPGVAVLSAVLLAVALGGCGTGGDDTDGAARGAATAGAEAAMTGVASAARATTVEAAEDGSRSAAGGAEAPAAPTSDASGVAAGRSLARLAVGQRIAQTADVTLRIGKDRLDETLDAIALDAQRLGGYVVSSTVGDAGRRAPVEATIVIRVPARRFVGALRSVGTRGTVVARTVGSEDVTQEYVDTQARLRHDRAVEARLLTLLGRAEKVGEVLAVQDRLATVQEEIEISKGRIEQLAGMTELSTIAVHLREPGVAATRPTPSDGWGVRAALREAAHNAVDVVNGGIVALGALLPVLLVAALLAPVALRLHRRRDGRRAPAGPPAADAG